MPIGVRRGAGPVQNPSPAVHTLWTPVWNECIRCPKFPGCGEIAVVYDLVRGQSTAKMLFDDDAMESDALAVSAHVKVPLIGCSCGVHAL